MPDLSFLSSSSFWFQVLIGVLMLVGFVVTIYIVGENTPHKQKERIRQRKHSRTHCHICDYDLSGTPSKCPECGTVRTNTRLRR